MSADLIRSYYDAFNRGDRQAMLALLTDDVAHDINLGGRETGKETFARFLAHMDRCYQEEIRDLVVMTTADGGRAAAEFMVEGTYLATDVGLPMANGQRYRLLAGTFFEVRDGLIARVTTCYNLRDWIRQVEEGT